MGDSLAVYRNYYLGTVKISVEWSKQVLMKLHYQLTEFKFLTIKFNLSLNALYY